MTTNKILFVSDDCRIHTGFGRVVREVILRLLKLNKYQISQHGWFSKNLQFNVPIPIYPTKKGPNGQGFLHTDVYGEESFDPVCAHVRPNLVIAIGNPHMLVSTVKSKFRNTYRLLQYSPVDNFHPGKDWGAVMSNADSLYLFVPWAQAIVERCVPDARVTGIIPHGVNNDTFSPMGSSIKLQTRKQLNLTKEDFVVGFVGRNLERKRIDSVVQLTGMMRNGWYSTKDGQVKLHTINRIGEKIQTEEGEPGEKLPLKLVLHTPIDDPEGAPLSPSFQFFGLDGHVLGDTSYKVGAGVPDNQLNLLYNSMDVFVSMATGGWELANSEAMSAGVPNIIGNWSAQPDFSTSALKVDPVAWIADKYSGAVRPIPNLDQAATHLLNLYNNRVFLKTAGLLARKEAENYSWDKIAKIWEDVIDKELIHKPKNPYLEV